MRFFVICCFLNKRGTSVSEYTISKWTPPPLGLISRGGSWTQMGAEKVMITTRYISDTYNRFLIVIILLHVILR